jgi:hypothetical protein
LETLTGRGQGGPCLTDAAQEAAPGAAVRNLPLRRDPNDAAAIIAAKVTRGHLTSVFASCAQIYAHLYSGERRGWCQWGTKPASGLSHIGAATRCVPLPRPRPRAACSAGWPWGGVRGWVRGGGANLTQRNEENAPPPTPPHTRSASTLLVGEGSTPSALRQFRSYAMALQPACPVEQTVKPRRPHDPFLAPCREARRYVSNSQQQWCR